MLYKYNNEALLKKWSPVLDCEDLPKIGSADRRLHTAVLLENTEIACREERQQMAQMNGQLITETVPVNSAGASGYTTAATATGPVAGFDPILISLIRRNMPVLMGYDIMGVQPMTGPTGLIFAMRSVYANTNAVVNSTAQNEALYQEANNFGGNTSLTFTSPFANTNLNPGGSNTTYGSGGGYPNNIAEDLGGGTTLNQMGFSIEKVTVTANTRGLQAGYTLELAQDLKAVHGLDAETELANILTTEILAEINREVIRTVYITAKVGCATSNSAGTYNLATAAGDADGRWMVEKYKGLVFQVEREANKIGKDTRRGKGNIVLCSTDVASALALSGLLDYNSEFKQLTSNGLSPADDNGSTFIGTLLGRIKVYVDPYSVSGAEYMVVGYKGGVAYDAGLFYCPYVPLQMVRAIDPNTYQPKIGFKTRYGLVANPFAEGSSQGLGRIAAGTNQWYRKFIVSNLK
jgi:hypothetical protein